MKPISLFLFLFLLFYAGFSAHLRTQSLLEGTPFNDLSHSINNQFDKLIKPANATIPPSVTPPLPSSFPPSSSALSYSPPPSDFDGFMEIIARDTKTDIVPESPHFTQKIDVSNTNTSISPFSLPLSQTSSSLIPASSVSSSSSPSSSPSLSFSPSSSSISSSSSSFLSNPLSSSPPLPVSLSPITPTSSPSSSSSGSSSQESPSFFNSFVPPSPIPPSSLFTNLIKPDWENDPLLSANQNDTALKELNDKIDKVTKILENLMKNEEQFASALPSSFSFHPSVPPTSLPSVASSSPPLTSSASSSPSSSPSLTPSISFSSLPSSFPSSSSPSSLTSSFSSLIPHSPSLLRFSESDSDDFDVRLEKLRRSIEESEI